VATDTRPDAELVTAWAAGDQSAFAAVYDRYADALFAFALSRLRDRAAAADAVQDTFLRAARRVDQLRDRTRLRAWLYAIARNQVIDAVRRPALLATTELDDMTSDERDPADVAAANDAAALLRDAALGLNERDQELLDLHLRHGLDGADLADVAGLSRPQSYVAMNRLRARLAKAIGVVLVARHGSRDCDGLAQVLRGWDGRFTLDMRSRVTRHVESCSTCAEQRTKLVAAVQLSPGALAIPFAAAPALLRRTTIERVAEAHGPVGADGTSAGPPGPGGETLGTPAGSGGETLGAPAGSGAETLGAPAGSGADVAVGPESTSPPRRHVHAWRRDGFPVAVDGAGRRRAAVLLAAAALIVALLAGVAVAQRDGDAADAIGAAPEPTVAAAATVATATTPVTTLVAVPTSATTTTAAASTTTSPTTAVETTSSVVDSLPAAPGSTEPGLVTPDATAPATAAPKVAEPVAEEPAPEEPAPDDTPAPPSPPPPPPPVETTVVVPPPPDPGRITVLSGPIALGASATAGTVRIRNDGGQPAAWSAATTNGAFGVSPSGGSLEPGQETDIAVGVDRSGLPEGAHSASVTVGAEHGGGAADVSATVERPPVISAFVRTPPIVRTSSSCGPTLVSVSVTASDESPIGSVAVQWSSDGTFAQLTDLSPNGGGSYTGQVGGFTSAGAHNLKAIVTDARGNSATQTISVTVIAC
jgi:RNA polymerase sigma factor (sigma-70 family)